MQAIKTVFKPAAAEVIEKKSRFIGFAAPCASEGAALAYINDIRKEHNRANHNCFAFITPPIVRCSDDGEPSGTAGMPMLDILKKEGMEYALVVVTRYFGGTLLGTGGLHRAYSAAAKAALEAACIITKEPYAKISISMNYDLHGKVNYELLQQGHIVHDSFYSDKVELIALVKHEQAQSAIKHITNVTAANANIAIVDNIYAAFVKEQDKLVLFEDN